MTRTQATFVGLVATAGLIVGLVIASVLTARNKSRDSTGVPLQPFTVSDFLSGALRPLDIAYQWVPACQAGVASRFSQFNESGVLVMVDAAWPTQQPAVLLADTALLARAASYAVSPGASQVLLALNSSALYRHSTLATYVAVRVADQAVQVLAGGAALRLAVWAPSAAGLVVAYVRENNVFIYDLDSAVTTQVTSDGASNRVINGVCDWVYEEEIFEDTRALWFSPAGGRLALLQFNETLVPTYDIAMYSDASPQYPASNRYKYPMPGYANSLVRLGVYDRTSSTLEWFAFDSLFDGADHYVTRVGWINETCL